MEHDQRAVTMIFMVMIVAIVAEKGFAGRRRDTECDRRYIMARSYGYGTH